MAIQFKGKVETKMSKTLEAIKKLSSIREKTGVEIFTAEFIKQYELAIGGELTKRTWAKQLKDGSYKLKLGNLDIELPFEDNGSLLEAMDTIKQALEKGDDKELLAEIETAYGSSSASEVKTRKPRRSSEEIAAEKAEKERKRAEREAAKAAKAKAA